MWCSVTQCELGYGKKQDDNNFYKNNDTFETNLQDMFRSYNDHLQLKVELI